jgi:heme A synthase
VTSDRLTRFAWLTLAWNTGVILFGAVVRATGSGAGCGSNWPTCRGDVVPLSGAAETAIEFTHRVTSGLALVLVAVLAAWVLRATVAGHPSRRAAVAAGVLVLVEAAIGAMLVLLEWVEDDASTGRAVSISLHLVNTLALLAALALTAWWLQGGSVPRRPFPKERRRLVVIGIAGLALVGASGAITALGDTLFPAESLLEGIRDDFTGTFLVRLRWIHPIVAVATAFFLVFTVRRVEVAGATGRRLAAAVESLAIGQLLLGALNVVLLAPVWMQVVHLLVADLTWVAFVLYSVEMLAADPS